MMFAGDNCELIGGVDRCFGSDEVREIAGGQGGGTESGRSCEEAAAVLVVLFEDMLRGDVGGADG